MSLAAATAVLLVAVAAPSGAAAAVEARNVSSETEFADFAHTYGTTVADFDDDGWDDAFAVRHYDSFPRLLLNRGGVFQDETATAFPGAPNRRDYHACPAADVDGNGEVDIYCTLGGKKGGRGPNPNELWLQQGGVFTERAKDFGVRDPFGRGRGATFIHANADAWPDLYVTNQFPRRDGRRGANQLFVNESGAGFRRAPEFGINVRNGAGTVQAVDFDLDGDEDLLVCAQRGLDIYRNVGETHFRAAADRVIPQGDCSDAAIAPMNRGPRPDLVLVRDDRVLVFMQKRSARFRSVPAYARAVSRARRIAVADATGDQRPDLYVLRAGRYDPRVERDEQVDKIDLMLENAGSGRDFSRLPLPSLRRGIGESVTPIDHDRNGLADFIVMNGKLKAYGPIRLTAFFERP